MVVVRKFKDKLKESKYGNRFKYQESVGRGSYSIVHLVLDTHVQELRVIKQPRNKYAQDNYERTFNTLGDVNNKNIMKVYDILNIEEENCLLAEYIDGITLEMFKNDFYNQSSKNFNSYYKDCIGLMIQLCNGLEIIHDKKQCVRDIKPSNLMIVTNGNLKITDFGSIYDFKIGHLTGTRAVPRYSAPEILIKKKRKKGFDHRIDIYSTGVVLYELLTNILLFDYNTDVELIKMKKNLIGLNPIEKNVNEFIDEIIKTCIQYDRNKRYKYVGTLKETLEFSRYIKEFDKNYSKLIEILKEENTHKETKVIKQEFRKEILPRLENLTNYILKSGLKDNKQSESKIEELITKMRNIGFFDYKVIDKFISEPLSDETSLIKKPLIKLLPFIKQSFGNLSTVNTEWIIKRSEHYIETINLYTKCRNLLRSLGYEVE